MERKFWEPEIETMPLDRLNKLQEENLQKEVAWAYERTAFYKRKFDQAGIKPGDIKSLNDLSKIPLTDYLSEFCRTPLEDKLAVPLTEVKSVCSTSGTISGIGQPIPFTRKDSERNCVQNGARGKWSIGARPSDIVQSLGFACLWQGWKALGATVLEEMCGRKNLDQQIKIANLMGITILEHLPTLALQYFERARELGIDIKKSHIRLVVGIGEGLSDSYKKKAQSEYGIRFCNGIYGLAEAGEVAAECEYGGGYHILSDQYIVEIIDPQTGRVLGAGEDGEIVVTNLYRQAMPILRYRTGDIGRILPYEPCPCGRTHPKISLIKGRLGQMLNIGDKKLFPVDVEEVLGTIPGLGWEYQIIRDGSGGLDRLRVRAEYMPEVKDLAHLKALVEAELSQKLGIQSQVELVPKGSIGRMLFKAQRVTTA